MARAWLIGKCPEIGVWIGFLWCWPFRIAMNHAKILFFDFLWIASSLEHNIVCTECAESTSVACDRMQTLRWLGSILLRMNCCIIQLNATRLRAHIASFQLHKHDFILVWQWRIHLHGFLSQWNDFELLWIYCSYAMLCSKRRNPGFNCQRPDKDRAAAGSLLLFEWILFNVVFFFYDGVSAGDVDL